MGWNEIRKNAREIFKGINEADEQIKGEKDIFCLSIAHSSPCVNAWAGMGESDSLYINSNAMNYIDIVLIALLLFGTVRGFLRGFVFEVAILGALFLGMYAGFHFAYLLQPTLLKMGKMNPHTMASVSFFIMFLLVSVGIFFLAKLFTGLINMAAMGIFNKILGALFGLMKYAFIISIVLYFFNPIDSTHNYLSPDKKAESRLYYPLLKISPALLPVLKEIREKVK